MPTETDVVREIAEKLADEVNGCGTSTVTWRPVAFEKIIHAVLEKHGQIRYAVRMSSGKIDLCNTEAGADQCVRFIKGCAKVSVLVLPLPSETTIGDSDKTPAEDDKV
jgi:hypothetical protein